MADFELSFDLLGLMSCVKSAQSATASFNAPGNELRDQTRIRYFDAQGNECEWGEFLDGNPYHIPEGGTINLTPASGALPPQGEGVAADDTLITEFSVTFNGQVVISLTELVPVPASSFLDLLLPGADTNALYTALVSLLDDDTTVIGSTINDGIELGAGNDTVAVGPGNDIVYKWKPGGLAFDGGDGSDTLSFNTQTGNTFPTPFVQTLVVDLATGTGQSPYGGALTLTSVENVFGTSQGDSITGDDNANAIGDGIFDTGADTIDAGGGNDTVRLAPFVGDFSVDGGAGFDELSFSIEDGTAAMVEVVLDLLNPALNTGPLAGASFANFEKFSASSLVSVGPDIFVFGGGNGDDFVVGQITPLFFPANEPFEDILSGRGGNDTIMGLLGRDSLDGGNGNDSLDGGASNDSLRGGGGNDSIAGGLGTDRAIFAGTMTSYTIQPGAQGAIVTGPDGTDNVTGVELLQFDDQAVDAPLVVFVGGASSLERDQGGPNLQIAVSLSHAVAQAVTVTATTSDGTAIAGSDYVAKSAQVTIPAGETSAAFVVFITPDTIFEPDETLTVTLSNPGGGAVLGTSTATGTILNDDEAVVPPPEVDQTITGSAASELIFGGALRDLVQGLGGADTVFAGDAADVLEGGADRDFLVAEGGADTGRGGDGDDVLFGGSGADSLLGEADVDFLFGEGGANTLDGGAGNDRIHINREDAIAAGGEGVFDVLVVLDAAGPLSINLGNAANQNTTRSGPVVTGIEAVDASLSNQPVNVTGAVLNGFGNVLFTSGFNDTVTGSSAIDIILGGGGDDILNGGNGADTLIADQGSDTLTGGAGADDFFHPGAGSTMRVADFAPGSDQVVLLAASGLTAEQALAGTSQQGADAVLALPNGGGTIILAGVQSSALSAGDFEIA